MINISLFKLNTYEQQIPSLYTLALGEQCCEFVRLLRDLGSIVGDNLMIANNTITVPPTVSNTAIYFVCVELFGHAPVNIQEMPNRQKSCTLE